MKSLLFLAVTLISTSLPALAETFTYEPSTYTFKGTLVSAKGETPDGEPTTFPALKLYAPITVQGDTETPTEKGVLLMHMVLDNKMMAAYKKAKGKPVLLTGSMFHSDNGNHQTNVLITPTAIKLTK